MTHYETEKEDLLSYFEQMLSDEPEQIAAEEPDEKELYKSDPVPSGCNYHDEITLTAAPRKFLSSRKNHPGIASAKAQDDAEDNKAAKNYADDGGIDPLCIAAKGSSDDDGHESDSAYTAFHESLIAQSCFEPCCEETPLNCGEMPSPEAADDNEPDACLNSSLSHYEDVQREHTPADNFIGHGYLEPYRPEAETEPQAVPSELRKSKMVALCTAPSIASLLEAINSSTYIEEAPAAVTKKEAAAEITQKKNTATHNMEAVTEPVSDAEVLENDTAVQDEPLKISSCEQKTEDLQKNLSAADETSEHAQKAQTLDKLPEILNWTNISPEDEFQVLFFKVRGVRFAVPLVELGGIYEIAHLTKIARRPPWYLGLCDMRGEKISVVDTLRYVKPEDSFEHTYQYMIVLNNSTWALGCDVLEGNRILEKEQVKFRLKAGLRPYLAGIVKKEMCALLHVRALIAMLDRGLALDALAQEHP